MKLSQPSHFKRGFSLVELSIVLVILGLLVGGVLSGQSLIRAAELRSVANDFARYHAAINTFRDKYFALPGDMTNATQFWGLAGGGGSGLDAGCYTTASADAKTCNGNGNGHLFDYDNVGDGSAPEWFRGWQHLANAGLIEGHYTGVRASVANRQALPGTNVPLSRVGNAGYTMMSINSSEDPFDWWPGAYDGFFFGKSTSDYETSQPALKPEEAWNIDTKLDDGKPGLGMLRDRKDAGGATDCNTTTTNTTAEYNLSNGAIVCSLFFAVNPPGNS